MSTLTTHIGLSTADPQQDKIVVHAAAGWRWKRTTWNNALIALSAWSYPNLEACLHEVGRVNAQPYTLEIHR